MGGHSAYKVPIIWACHWNRRMRNIVRKLAERLHAIEDHLTVRTQIAAAVAVMCVVLVGTLAGCAAFVSHRNTASLVNSSLAAVASATSRTARSLHGGAPARNEPVLAIAAAAKNLEE
jgi:hypothetical protein